MEDYELEQFFEDTMNNEFNSIIDDGSALQIAKLLLKYSELYRSGKLVELQEDISKRFASKAPNVQASVKCKNDQEDLLSQHWG